MYVVYGKPNCSFCDRATKLLEEHNKEYRYVDIMSDMDSLRWIKEQGYRTVPQIYKQGTTHVGGFEDLYKELVE